MSEASTGEYIPLNPIPRRWILSTLAAILISAALFLIFWDEIPDPMPLHWGLGGQVDGWARKSGGTVVALFALSGGILGAMAILVPWLIRSHAAHAHQGLPSKNIAQVNYARANANEMMKVIGKVLFVAVSLTMGTITYGVIWEDKWPVSPWLILAAIFVTAVWLIYSVWKADRAIKPFKTT